MGNLPAELTPIIVALIGSGTVLAVLRYFGGALARLLPQPKAAQQAALVGGYDQLIDQIQDQMRQQATEIGRLVNRLSALEGDNGALREQLKTAWNRIDDLERENRHLKWRLAQVEGNGA